MKWFLRRTTGLCELQRICYGEIRGAPRIYGVERSLSYSRSVQIKQLVNHLDDVSKNCRFVGSNQEEVVEGAVGAVLIIKKINPRVHTRFVSSFSTCIEQIWGYRQMLVEVESLRKIAYDSDNLEHERKLCELWSYLMPDVPLQSRISKQWQDIGFQGDDPKTDFRGMGLLGLENLLFFAIEYQGPASHVLSHSLHPDYGYAFAIVGINITSMAWQLLQDGSAKTYFYNVCRTSSDLHNFHQFYCYLFYEFDRFWIECKPKNIMEFSSIRERFESNIKSSLEDPTTQFRINISIDTV